MRFKKTKPKKCAECGESFTPANSFTKGCSYECNVSIALAAADKYRKEREKERKKESREELNVMREKLKDGPYYKKLLQSVFNTWVKLRDRGNGCISCGTTKPDIQYCAGHYWTVGSAPALRYHPDNVHLQCNKNCNLSLSGNIVNYRPALIKKIGQERFDALETQKGIPKHYTVDELKELIQLYRQKIKEMK